MPVCAQCGQDNPEAARFCNACAAPLVAPAGREQRKTVTVLFCDLVGSTSLGESTDPEAVRALLARYFERMKGIVERYGGTVEKFIGDAVMAVFSLPVVHEDDALRAVRAAVEMRDAFDSSRGGAIKIRILLAVSGGQRFVPLCSASVAGGWLILSRGCRSRRGGTWSLPMASSSARSRRSKAISKATSSTAWPSSPGIPPRSGTCRVSRSGRSIPAR
jgi:Adenylate and Guanylate cyclase catalytic domain